MVLHIFANLPVDPKLKSLTKVFRPFAKAVQIVVFELSPTVANELVA